MLDCWAKDPHERPSFKVIHSQIKSIQLECLEGPEYQNALTTSKEDNEKEKEKDIQAEDYAFSPSLQKKPSSYHTLGGSKELVKEKGDYTDMATIPSANQTSDYQERKDEEETTGSESQSDSKSSSTSSRRRSSDSE